MPKLTIIRGIPGSGKTTLAKKVQEGSGAFHLETDMLTIVDDKYDFDPELLKYRHENAQKIAKIVIENGSDLIVSNTFVKVNSMLPYLDLVRGRGYTIVISSLVSNNYGSIHDVPSHTIKNMKSSFEEEIPDDIMKKYNISLHMVM